MPKYGRVEIVSLGGARWALDGAHKTMSSATIAHCERALNWVPSWSSTIKANKKAWRDLIASIRNAMRQDGSGYAATKAVSTWATILHEDTSVTINRFLVVVVTTIHRYDGDESDRVKRSGQSPAGASSSQSSQSPVM